MTNRADQFAFDLEAGEAARDEGIERVSDHAYFAFIAAGRIAVRECSETLEDFTTDDVWALIPDNALPHDRRAMVMIMKHAQREGWITATDQFIKSLRPTAHAGPKRVWHSNLYRWTRKDGSAFPCTDEE